MLHPRVSVEELIHVTGYDDDGWHCVQYGEDANSHHQLLQLVGLGARVFHGVSDVEERDEAGNEEDGAKRQIDDEWSHDIPNQRRLV